MSLTDEDRAAINKILGRYHDTVVDIREQAIAEHFLRLGQERMRERAAKVFASQDGEWSADIVAHLIRALKVE